MKGCEAYGVLWDRCCFSKFYGLGSSLKLEVVIEASFNIRLFIYGNNLLLDFHDAFILKQLKIHGPLGVVSQLYKVDFLTSCNNLYSNLRLVFVVVSLVKW